MSASGHTSGSEIRVVVLLVREGCVQGSSREMMGSEIRRRLGIGPGTLYPILARLREGGLLVSRTEEGSPRDLGRPAGNFLQVTAQGRAWLETWLESAGLALAPATDPRSDGSVPGRPWSPGESQRVAEGPEPNPDEWTVGPWLLVRLADRGLRHRLLTPTEEAAELADTILDSLGYPGPDKVDVDVRVADPAVE